jgi:hypothetical protein
LAQNKALQKTLYDKYGKSFADAVNKVFGKDTAKVLPQTLANAPHLDLTKTRADLQKMGKGEAAESRNHADFADPNRPSLAQNGTIFIPTETVASGNMKAISGDYAHELANLLDFQINRYSGPIGPELNYGNESARDRTKTLRARPRPLAYPWAYRCSIFPSMRITPSSK